MKQHVQSAKFYCKVAIANNAMTMKLMMKPKETVS